MSLKSYGILHEIKMTLQISELDEMPLFYDSVITSPILQVRQVRLRSSTGPRLAPGLQFANACVRTSHVWPRVSPHVHVKLAPLPRRCHGDEVAANQPLAPLPPRYQPPPPPHLPPLQRPPPFLPPIDPVEWGGGAGKGWGRGQQSWTESRIRSTGGCELYIESICCRLEKF